MDGLTQRARGSAPSLTLRDGEVHLWWGREGGVESLDASSGWLSDEERRQGERFHRPRDARAFRFRRAFLRAVLARYVGRRPRDLVFTRGAFGRPALTEAGAPSFNATSRAGVVLVGVTRAVTIGVDLELDPSPLVGGPEGIARLAQRVATPLERARLAEWPLDERARAFLTLWTRKEALLKALGTGLAREPGTLAVGWSAGECEREALGPGWEPRWLECGAPPGVVASAVVAMRPGESVRLVFP
jgi:4'-phosphopantetheinyl transferase